MRKGEKINFIFLIIADFIFLFIGITSLFIQLPAYKEVKMLQSSGAHCIGNCGFWHFFLWPIVFILIAIGLIIFGVLWYKEISTS